MRHSKKAIKAEIRNKIAKEYRNKYKNKLATLYKSISKYRSENDQLKYLNEELTEKNQKQEAWINRLLDFCDLPENERKIAFDFFIASANKTQEVRNGSRDIRGLHRPVPHLQQRHWRG